MSMMTLRASHREPVVVPYSIASRAR